MTFLLVSPEAFLNLIVNSIEQGLIYGILVLGVYITYKILDFPDLSVDGSFPLGGAVAATLIISGVNPFLATLIAIVAGMLAGFVTGFLHVKLKITNLLSGILVMIGLYSINLRVMGKANIPLFNESTVFSSGLPVLLMIAVFAIAMKIIMDLFLKTKLGFLIKATGDNPQLVTSLGMDIGYTKIISLMLANGLVALSGALVAQYQGFADITMGTGRIVMGLASVIIGIAIFKRLSFMAATTMVLIGSILYNFAIGFALLLGLPPTDLKLITSIIVIVALAINNKKGSFKLKAPNISGGGSRVASAKPNKGLQ